MNACISLHVSHKLMIFPYIHDDISVQLVLLRKTYFGVSCYPNCY